MLLKISSAKWWPFCPGRDELDRLAWAAVSKMTYSFKCAINKNPDMDMTSLCLITFDNNVRDVILLWGIKTSVVTICHPDYIIVNLILNYFYDIGWEQSKSVINSSVPRRCGNGVNCLISKHMFRIEFMIISCKLILWWMLQNTFDDKSTLDQKLARCHHQTSRYYLSQCWQRSILPYVITRLQLINCDS